MRHVRDGTSWSGEFAVQHRDGTIFQVLVTDSPVYDAEGNVIGIVGVSQDITERRKADEALRASEQRFRAIFDNVGVGIALDSLEGKPVESNPALQRMLGYTRDELARLHFTDLTHKEDVAVEEALFDELVAGARLVLS
jgi:PAS domain-containing protein